MLSTLICCCFFENVSENVIKTGEKSNSILILCLQTIPHPHLIKNSIVVVIVVVHVIVIVWPVVILKPVGSTARQNLLAQPHQTYEGAERTQHDKRSLEYVRHEILGGEHVKRQRKHGANRASKQTSVDATRRQWHNS